MPLPSARLAALAAALLAAGCQRQPPQGAEAAAHAADQPRPVVAALVPQAAPVADAQGFAGQASAADAFEIAAAQTAVQRSQNAAVKGFAEMMAYDHMNAAAEFKTALAEAGRTLTPSGGLTPDQQARLDELRRIDAKAFDKTYMDGQMLAHRQALELMQAYAQNGDVPALKAFAGKAGAVAQHHLDLAETIDEQLP